MRGYDSWKLDTPDNYSDWDPEEGVEEEAYGADDEEGRDYSADKVRHDIMMYGEEAAE